MVHGIKGINKGCWALAMAILECCPSPFGCFQEQYGFIDGLLWADSGDFFVEGGGEHGYFVWGYGDGGLHVIAVWGSSAACGFWVRSMASA